MLDYLSLLLAAGLSGLCLGLTMFALWLPTRQERFLLTWTVGVFLLVAHVLAYWRYVIEPHPAVGMLMLVLLPLGFCFVYSAAHQFFSRENPRRRVAVTSVITLAALVPPMAAGYDGIALILQNALAATLLALPGYTYWKHRAQAPAVLSVLAALYLACALSFAACGLVILDAHAWVIGHAPDNWAERVNIVVSVSCLSVVGALSIALNQMLVAHRHKTDSMTDPLTGLWNRRALLSLYDDRRLGPSVAVVMFDLDNFKPVNDVYGHSVGDEVIMRFASAAKSHSRPRDEAVRIGGEEFALVMPEATPEEAQRTAGRIAEAFSHDTVTTPTGPLRCTVSAGIGFGSPGGASLEEVLERADRALYAAKRAGRNRMVFDPVRLAG